MFIIAFMFEILKVLLKDAFPINIFSLLDGRYWKIIFSIWMIKNIFSGKDLYKELNFDDLLRKTREKKYNYTSPENIMVNKIERYNMSYTMQAEKLGILKSLTPISLLPLIAGYVLEGKNISVDWNWYTVAFVSILFVYFYNVWKCYKNMELWKLRIEKVKEELRDMQYNKECTKEESLSI